MPKVPTNLLGKLGFRRSSICRMINAAHERFYGPEEDDGSDKAAGSLKTTQYVKDKTMQKGRWTDSIQNI